MCPLRTVNHLLTAQRSGSMGQMRLGSVSSIIRGQPFTSLLCPPATADYTSLDTLYVGIKITIL